MPKGVEHIAKVQNDGAVIGEIEPLMPKGVEHLIPGVGFLPCCKAIEPLMPKGVEHIMFAGFDLRVDGARSNL